jgi:hypothetical protein
MTTTENEDHQRWIGAVEGYRMFATDEEREGVIKALLALDVAAADGGAFQRVAALLENLTADTAPAQPPDDDSSGRKEPAHITAVRAFVEAENHAAAYVSPAAIDALLADFDAQRRSLHRTQLQRDTLEQKLARVTGKLAEMVGGDVEEGDIALVEKVWARNAQMLRIWGPVHRYQERRSGAEQATIINLHPPPRTGRRRHPPAGAEGRCPISGP